MKEKSKKKEILHWDTRNNNAMLVVVGKASTGKSSILRLSELRKEYLSSLPKPLNEQVIVDRPCSARKIGKEINKNF
ncbi:MAG: hypothetical protein WAQ98_17845 [Blastocatellia bacterium]